MNDPAGDASTFAHLLNFDCVQGRWGHEARGSVGAIEIADRRVRVTDAVAIADGDWTDYDVVIEASGRMRKVALLETYLTTRYFSC